MVSGVMSKGQRGCQKSVLVSQCFSREVPSCRASFVGRTNSMMLNAKYIAVIR